MKYAQINDIYESTYTTHVYTPIYAPAIIFYDEEEQWPDAEA